MSIFAIGEVFGLNDMAKARAGNVDADNNELIASFIERLDAANTDRASFDSTFADLKSDKRLRAADIISIAHRYVRGGKKPSSRTMALATISKRFVEIVRYHAKNEVAAKARPW